MRPTYVRWRTRRRRRTRIMRGGCSCPRCRARCVVRRASPTKERNNRERGAHDRKHGESAADPARSTRHAGPKRQDFVLELCAIEGRLREQEVLAHREFVAARAHGSWLAE